MAERENKPSLQLVATPIGNVEDITVRALRALRECDVVLAEDTRRTRMLMQAHGIDRPVERVDENTIAHRAEGLVSRMKAGETFALVTDAGTPAVSDPGAVLVRACCEQDVAVQALPGASAVLTAWALTGFVGGGFRFVGFLPRDGSERAEALAAIARDPLATVFFEAGRRMAETLQDLLRTCGAQRRVVIGRELTKVHEEVLRGDVETLTSQVQQALLGEVTVVVHGATRHEASEQGAASAEHAMTEAIEASLRAGMKPAHVAREVAKAMGLDRAVVYRAVLERARERDA